MEKIQRRSGVLLHISSLPGEHGIGSLGDSARKFARFLKESGFTYWQILPVNETDEWNSPYKSPSAFAGNPFFISLKELQKQNLLTEQEVLSAKQKTPYICEFEVLHKNRLNLLKKAYSRINDEIKSKIEKFKLKNKWLAEYAEFMTLKNLNGGIPWQKWKITSLGCKNTNLECENTSLGIENTSLGCKNTILGSENTSLECENTNLGYKNTKTENGNTQSEIYDVEFYCFLQYEFFRQWAEFKTYANKIGIKIIGDMPIYVSEDSADVYYNRDIFQLDEAGEKLCEAGVPPDYFAKEGQGWGNPLYNWDKLKADGYKWWLGRIEHSLEMFDMVRIDHFRGFSEYWSIPKGKNPIQGKWEKGPGADFFIELKKHIPKPAIIAEDLGDIDQKVIELLELTKFPGMRVMQFGFIDDEDNPHLPHNYINNTVAYTGTHDNNTLLGWLWELTPEKREYALKYCSFKGTDQREGGTDSQALRAIIKSLYQSSAGIVILPIQDLCGFGRDTRMNIPGVSQNNWSFRITEQQLETIDKNWFLKLAELYKR